MTTEVVALSDRLQARAVEGGWCRPPTRALMYNSFDRTTSGILFMIFQRGSRRPAVVAKLSRDISTIRREYETLVSLEEMEEPLSPRPLFFERLGGFGVLGMEAVSGAPLRTAEERMCRLPRVVEGLAGMHRRLQRGVMDPGTAAARFREAFDGLAALGVCTAVDGAYLSLGSELAARLGRVHLPCIPQHGDFYFENLVVEGDKVRAIDWEDFGAVAFPAYDLFTLLGYLLPPTASVEDRGAGRRREIVGTLRDTIEAYFRALDIPVTVVRALWAYATVTQFLHAHRLGRSSAEMLGRRLPNLLADGGRFWERWEGEGAAGAGAGSGAPVPRERSFSG